MMFGVIVLRINLSRTLTGLNYTEIGLYADGSVGILFGVSIDMILPFFQMFWMLLWTIV